MKLGLAIGIGGVLANTIPHPSHWESLQDLVRVLP